MPKVSVVIPNYNHARYLRQRIESVIGQTFRDFEVILLDDCSTDESRSILNEYAADPRVRIEFNGKNSGSTFKQWNKGVRLARGEYIWIAESDDYADLHFLERLVQRLDEQPSAAFCNCRSFEVSSEGVVKGFFDPHLDPPRWTKDFLADGCEECRTYLVRCNTVLNASSVLFRKAKYEEVGGADETLVYCGDWKLWAAMLLNGKRAYIGEPLNYYRTHDITVTAKVAKFGTDAVEYLQVIRWILDRVTPTEGTLAELCSGVFYLWSPRVLTNRIPLGRRWTILMSARAVDRRAMWRLVRPGLEAIRFKVLKELRVARQRLASRAS